VHPLAATKHGADHEPIVGPLRTAHLERLRVRFPTADDPLLVIEAQRAAILDVLGGYLDRRGLIRNKRTGLVNPALDRWAKTASAFERTYERLEAMHRESAADPGERLRAAEARIVAEREQAKRPALSPARNGDAEDGGEG